MNNLVYRYTPMKDINRKGEYCFYGVIFDASFPSFDDLEKLFICTVKLIDPDINCLTYPNDLNDNLIHVIIKSYEKENLPFIHSIGDIFRVHRGYFRKSKKKNVYLNIQGGKFSSWVIFKYNDFYNYAPFFCSSKNFTFQNNDKIIINQFREWACKYFCESNSLEYQKESKLINRNNENFGDNDSTVQVIQKTVLNDKIILFIQDETDSCELHTYLYFSFINILDVIRIRSFKNFDWYIL